MVDDREGGPGPVLSRLRLRTELRRLREQQQITQEEVAQRLGWSTSKMIRVERGTSRLSVHDVHTLLRLYGVTDVDELARMSEWARRGRRRDWWADYKNAIGGSYSGYVGLEAEATTLSMFETTLVPGLLQTREYAQAVIDALWRTTDPLIEYKNVELRLHRQRQVLSQTHPPALRFVIDEAVLQRTAGSSMVMREQLRHLIAVAALPHVTLRILPFAAGMHPGLSGFATLEFDDGSGVVVVESIAGMRLLEEIEIYQHCVETFDRLLDMSLDPDTTTQMIDEAATRQP